MSQTDPATQKQMTFLWNLFQGAHQMNLAAHLDPTFQTEQGISQVMQAGLNRQQCSELIDDLIYRVGAVPAGKEIKYATEKQISLYRTLAGELAGMGEAQWQNIDMNGRTSWTVSMFITKLKDIKDRSAPQQASPQQQWGQQPAAPPQQQWGQPQQQWGQPQQQQAAPPVQQQWGQPQQAAPSPPPAQQQWPPQAQPPVAAAPQPPYFDSQGNPINLGAGEGLPFE